LGIVLSFLSNYQRSVLQELGITFWLTQAEAASTSTETNSRNDTVTPAATPQTDNSDSAHKPISTKEKQSRLAQLRAQVSSGSSNDKSPSKQQPEEKVSPVRSLTQSERTNSSQWLVDMALALSHLESTLTVDCIVIGDALAVSTETIVLPMPPHALTPPQKKALWMQLIALSSPK